MDSLISVIVPVYNVEKFLRRCVQSILDQTYKNLEIILVDDGSTDDSGEICDEFCRADVRVKVIHRKNGGLSAARNSALDVAKGDYIAFVDSDDFIDERMFRILSEELETQGADMVMCGYRKWLEESDSLKDIDVKLPEGMLIEEEAFALLFSEELSVFMPVAWNKLYKRELWENLRYPEGKYHEDEHVIHHLINRCKKIAVTSESLYFYSIRKGSIMATRSLKAGRDWIEALVNRLQLFEDTEREELAEQQQRKCIRMILWECKKRPKLNRETKEFIRAMARQTKELLKRRKINGVLGARIFILCPVLYVRCGRMLS